MRAPFLILLGVLFGCAEAYIVSDGDAGSRDAGSVDATPDAVVASGCRPGAQPPPGMGAEGPCELRVPPPRPRECRDDPEDGDPIELAFLTTLFNQSLGEAWDIDGYCSGDTGEPAPCVQDEGAVIDGAMGQDNAFLSIVEGILAVDSGIEERFAMTNRAGRFVPMIRVVGWNGELYDDQVEFTVAVSARGAGPGGGPPQWMGEDVLDVASSFYQSDLTTPLARDRDAYVADGVLVARAGNGLPFIFDGSSRRLEVTLRDIRATLDMNSESRGEWELKLGGRWSVTDASAVLDLLGLCEGSTDPLLAAQRRFAEGLLSRWADVHVLPSETDTGLECGALSLHVGWREAVPVRWGAVVTPEFSPNPCQ